MSILGIGIDIVHLPRVASLISRRGALRVASRILSIPELSDWKSSPLSSQTRFLVVRWAVKEAAYKALYPVVKPKWKELTYRGLRDGMKPTVEYCPIVSDERKKMGKMHVSVSHDGEYVFASVLVESAD